MEDRSTVTAVTIENENQHVLLPRASFHKNITFSIVLAQLFGLMPVQRVSRKNIYEISFTWKSPRIAYTIFNLAGTFFMGTMCVLRFCFDGFMLDKSETASFYILNFFGTWQFIRISQNWSRILKDWSMVEMSMRSYNCLNLGKRFKWLALIIMGLALVEHLLFILNALMAAQKCEHFSSYPAEDYFGIAFPHVFTVIGYSHWKAALIEFINITSTFTWNFTDVFIILISYSLASSFKLINERLKMNKTMHEKFWREVREDYNRLSRLCLMVDKHLGALVMITFINNTFFICIQLYNSLKVRVTIIESVYFFYSFGFLLIRTLVVALFAAKIYEESRKPLEYLHSVPSENYCVEVRRFINQINFSHIGLTGSKFFLVTRSFLLRMAGTIITFELMLLEFGPLIKTTRTISNNDTYDCIK